MPAIFPMSPLSSPTAARLLGALCRTWEASLAGNTALAKEPYQDQGKRQEEAHANLMALRGKDLGEAERRLKRAVEKLLELYGSADTEAIADDFDAILGENA